MFLVIEKETNKIKNVYDVLYILGNPLFLFYENNEWTYHDCTKYEPYVKENIE